MTINEALKYFKSGYEICSKLNIRPSNYTRWKIQNFIPIKQQHRINEIIGFNLPIDLDKKAMEIRVGNILTGMNAINSETRV